MLYVLVIIVYRRDYIHYLAMHVESKIEYYFEEDHNCN